MGSGEKHAEGEYDRAHHQTRPKCDFRVALVWCACFHFDEQLLVFVGFVSGVTREPFRFIVRQDLFLEQLRGLMRPAGAITCKE